MIQSACSVKNCQGNVLQKKGESQCRFAFLNIVEIFLLKFNRPLQFVFYFLPIANHIFLIYIWAYRKIEVVHLPFLAWKLFF